jgi:hypothetical protein
MLISRSNPRFFFARAIPFEKWESFASPGLNLKIQLEALLQGGLQVLLLLHPRRSQMPGFHQDHLAIRHRPRKKGMSADA